MALQHKEYSIIGTSFYPGSWSLIERLNPRVPLTLKREPNNKADPNAVAVFWSNKQLGYLPRGLAKEVAPKMDAGVKYVTRKSPKPLAGVCILQWDDGQPDETQLHQHADDGGPVPEKE